MLSERIDLARKPSRLRISSPTATPGLGAERAARFSCLDRERSSDEPSHGASACPAAAVMTSRIEPSRRHGPFDPRWRKRRLRLVSAQPVAARLEDVGDGLDWESFSSHYFPGRGRHDLEAISAYDAYKHGRQWRTGSRPKPRRRSTRLEARRDGGTPVGGRASSSRPVAAR